MDGHSFLNIMKGARKSKQRQKLLQFFPRTRKHDLVLCSGTTMGTVREVKSYLIKLIELFGTVVQDSAMQKDGFHDQGYHNWLYYSGNLSQHNVRVFRPGEENASVLTMNSIGDFSKDRPPFLSRYLPVRIADGSFDAGYFRTVYRRDMTHGYFLDEGGWVIPALHQWDRIRPAFVDGGDWLQSTLLFPTKRAVDDQVHTRRSEWCEWVDGCTWCPNGIYGCLRPVTHVVRHANGQEVRSSPSKCTPVSFDVGGLCSDVAVKVEDNIIPPNTYVAECANRPHCVESYRRHEEAAARGLNVSENLEAIISGRGWDAAYSHT
eukprot:TRINITY_DN8253_c0_g2_i1.p1 TRINITY_DN8253_c0_g2~~TRINITY_DN8253_c0_g2_i1.p1  ORF type:complete len:370 (-),score=12.10 TRINITY_DN8253_c0_g2_i1:457-1416(-)